MVKTIGVIGGLGPMATVYFLECVTRMTKAKIDQEHPRIYMLSCPDIPDRTAYILGESAENPLEDITNMGLELQKMGADFLAIPCITAHYFLKEIESKIDIPVVHLTEELAQDIRQKEIKKVGILATTGTIQSGVIRNELEGAGIEVVVPDKEHQEFVMEIIYHQIKSGESIDWDMVHKVVRHMLQGGSQKIILGCTELPLLKKDVWMADSPELGKILHEDCIDVLEVLAQKAILYSGAKLKEKYIDII